MWMRLPYSRIYLNSWCINKCLFPACANDTMSIITWQAANGTIAQLRIISFSFKQSWNARWNFTRPETEVTEKWCRIKRKCKFGTQMICFSRVSRLRAISFAIASSSFSIHPVRFARNNDDLVNMSPKRRLFATVVGLRPRKHDSTKYPRFGQDIQFSWLWLAQSQTIMHGMEFRKEFIENWFSAAFES